MIIENNILWTDVSIPVAGFEAKIRRLNKLCICDTCHKVHPAADLEWGLAFHTSTCKPPELGIYHFTKYRRIRCFADSNSDWLDERWPIETLARFLKAIHEAPNVDFQLLTKRPENWLPRLDAIAKLWACDGSYRETPAARCYHDLICPWRAGKAPPNIWIGISAENQEYADSRIPDLLKIPAVIKFLSCEPLLGPIDLQMALEEFQPLNPDLSKKPSPIQWVIAGGESGPHARPCDIGWIGDILAQCSRAGIAAFGKQLGSKPTGTYNLPSKIKDKKGGDMAEWPEDLRVRQMPK